MAATVMGYGASNWGSFSCGHAAHTISHVVSQQLHGHLGLCSLMLKFHGGVNQIGYFPFFSRHKIRFDSISYSLLNFGYCCSILLSFPFFIPPPTNAKQFRKTTLNISWKNTETMRHIAWVISKHSDFV